MLAIIGSLGNMARRYKAICDFYEIPSIGFDLNNIKDISQYKDQIKSILIATPTETHMDLIFSLGEMGKPILCEKPISKSMAEIERLMSSGLSVKMVNQYEYLYDPKSHGPSCYRYWNSGKDGIKWDCINIIGLAEEEPTIRNDLPFWTCMINGKELELSDMDGAYAEMIQDFYRNPTSDLEYIKKAHSRVHAGFYVTD